MSSPKKLPAHGTVARYRLELKDRVDGKPGKTCDRCRAANSEHRRNARSRSVGRPSSPAKLSLVSNTREHTSGDTPEQTPVADTTPPAAPDEQSGAGTNSDSDNTQWRGPMGQAVELDLAEITADQQVPFHRTLSAMARELARDIDDGSTSTATKRDARKQLFDVLKSLRTRKEGDGNSALDIVLEDFGVPLVSELPS